MFASVKSGSKTAGVLSSDYPRPPVLAARARLGELFPESPEPAPSSPLPRLVAVALQAALVLAAVPLMLLRSAGRPVWDTVYGEDLGIFLVQAIQHPWHLFIPYAGYLQLFTRLLANVVMSFPLKEAAREFAMAGALAAAGSALVVYHASAGHIRSRWLRLVLAAAVVLLPVAPLEIVDSGVDLTWYTMIALFFAALWRPRTRTGMAVAALVAFITASANTMAVAFTPLFAIRLFVLRRPRDHVVTAGWLTGCALQVPVMLAAIADGDKSHLTTGWGTPHDSLAFYGHDVVLPAAGWRLSWWLRDLMGTRDATVLMAAALAVVFGTILARQARSRVFVLTALVSGCLFSVLAATLRPWTGITPAAPYHEPGARYTTLLIFLLEAAAIVAVDHMLRADTRRLVSAGPGEAGPDGVRGISRRLLPALAVVTLVAVLASAWTADFRYCGVRGNVRPWAPQAAHWKHACRHSTSGDIAVWTSWGPARLPCDRLRF